MSYDLVMGFVRQTLTFVGGIFLAKGLVDETTMAQLVGALSTLIGFGWALYHHHAYTSTPRSDVPPPAAPENK